MPCRTGSGKSKHVRVKFIALILLVLMALPLLLSAWGALTAAWHLKGWQDLAADPQTPHALLMTLWTGVLSSALALGLCALLLQWSFPGRGWPALVRVLSPLLAVPHAAFAIGLAFLIAPSGWLLRLLSPWATGLQAPPPWPTTQDPWGLGLVAVLVAKEVPFLLWVAATELQRPDVAQRLALELQVARSLGYSAQRAWWCVLWPQLLPRLQWPLLAVLIYSLNVVDMALVIGPTSPPTLSVLAWQWLQDADAARNAQGAVAGWLLVGVVVVLASLAWWLSKRPIWQARRTAGWRGHTAAAKKTLPKPWHGHGSRWVLLPPYLAVMLALAVGSVAGLWPFPAVWPQTLTWQAWQSVAHSADTLWNTLSLATSSAVLALCWSVAWLECAPKRWQTHMQRLIYLPLVLPPVLWVVGVHSLALHLGWDASWVGVALAHTLSATPYVLMALSPAYGGFDTRLKHVAASLGHGHWVFLWHVKWPLLRAALAYGFAIGFAVSVAQYLPTLFVGAGRFGTVTTEAVTLAAGAQRTLTAAYAWLQWLLPVLVFALAAWTGRAKRY
jgi:putative thiamine transport system permease protein